MKTARRNLTLNLPVDLIRRAKVEAAQRDMSLNAWIQEAIDQTMRFRNNRIAAGEKILRAAEKGLFKMPQKKVTRAELYER